MRAAIRNETAKFFTHKKYIVFMVIGVAVSVFWSFLGNMITAGLSALSGQMLYIELGFTPTSSLPLFGNVLLPFLIFMGAADLFTAEFSDATIKASLIRPISRHKLYIAKVAAIFFYTALYLAVILAVGIVTGLISGAVRTPGALFGAIGAYALTLVPMLVMIVFAAIVALSFSSGSLVMFLLIVLLLSLYALPLFLPWIADLLFTNYLMWYSLWLGSAPAFGRMLNICLILFGYGAVFTFGGMLLFEGKDV